ncbi:MAG TPA: helix-turn-helix transcriptional regulator [Mogibacterium sp.]|nr:helix-turn-helix transcriptional regulator [Mogibacterium sp.]
MYGNLYKQIGKKLRVIRKARQGTIQELANYLNKSISTVAKYETGEIAVDLEILLDICNFYNISIQKILPETNRPDANYLQTRYRDFVVDRMFLYCLRQSDGSIQKSAIENNNDTMTSHMFWDFISEDNYMDCKLLYSGNVYYSDYNTFYVLFNLSLPFDMITISLPSNITGSPYCYGMITSLTMHYQNMARKVLVSKEPISNNILTDLLPITAKELKELKRTNCFTIGE